MTRVPDWIGRLKVTPIAPAVVTTTVDDASARDPNVAPTRVEAPPEELQWWRDRFSLPDPFALVDSDTVQHRYWVRGTDCVLKLDLGCENVLTAWCAGALDVAITQELRRMLDGTPITAESLRRAAAHVAARRAIVERVDRDVRASIIGTDIERVMTGRVRVEPRRSTRATTWELARQRVAEQVSAGGVDCAATRAAARRRVLADLRVVEHVEWCVRAVHRDMLGRLADSNDGLAWPGFHVVAELGGYQRCRG